MTHKQKILNLLEEAGERGVHSFTLANSVTFRAAARINDLRNEGYDITAKQEKKGNSYGVRYFLEE
jgi:hypothetical protein